MLSREREKDIQPRGKLLLPEIEEFEKYTYAAFVTKGNFSDVLNRSDYENRIKELKSDYGVEGFCMESFYALGVAFRLEMISQNLMALFKPKALNNRHLPTLLSIKF